MPLIPTPFPPFSMERNEALPYEAQAQGMPWEDWESVPEFLDSLDRTPKGVNLQAGHTSTRSH